MARARNRVLDGYVERHHVVPKCMGGGNESANIVRLTGEEHYVAHQLLVKMYPDVPGLCVAAMRMSKQCTGNKAYAWIRQRVATSRIGRRPNFSPEAMQRMRNASTGNKHALGHRHSPEALRKISEASKGNKFAATGMAGRHLGLATRAPTNFKDLTGKVFGHLTVMRETSPQKGKARWICVCYCGKEIAVTGSNLQVGQYSCGCTRYRKRKTFSSDFLRAA